jgi:chromosome partitioning protein
MQTIGVFHTKGGVGKSAVAVFLADFLSSLHGNRVLLVDLDPQGSASRAIIPQPQLDEAVSKGRSLTRLLGLATNGGPAKPAVDQAIVRRPAAGKPRKGSVPLGEVAVLATSRAEYRRLTDAILAVPAARRKKHLTLLRTVLDAAAADHDIAIIDFPGSEIPFWTQMGLRATDRWLLPEIPDFFSASTIDDVVTLVKEVEDLTGHAVKPLGTLLTICPNRGSTVYKRTRSALGHLEKLGAIPRLFPKDAEILHRPEAQKSIDWEAEKAKTLTERYGASTSPFHVGLRKLANEVLERLGTPSSKDKITYVADLRRKLTDYWR